MKRTTLKLVNRYLPKVVYGRKQNALAMNHEPKTHNQSGFAPIALIVLLLFGIGAGTILVQNGVNFLPKAQHPASKMPAQEKIESPICANGSKPYECPLGGWNCIPPYKGGTCVPGINHENPSCPAGFIPRGNYCVQYSCPHGYKLEGSYCSPTPQIASESFSCNTNGSMNKVKIGLIVPCSIGGCTGNRTAVVTTCSNSDCSNATCEWSSCVNTNSQCYPFTEVQYDPGKCSEDSKRIIFSNGDVTNCATGESCVISLGSAQCKKENTVAMQRIPSETCNSYQINVGDQIYTTTLDGLENAFISYSSTGYECVKNTLCSLVCTSRDPSSAGSKSDPTATSSDICRNYTVNVDGKEYTYAVDTYDTFLESLSKSGYSCSHNNTCKINCSKAPASAGSKNEPTSTGKSNTKIGDTGSTGKTETTKAAPGIVDTSCGLNSNGLEIPCYKIGVFTPEELQATEADARIASKRYEDFTRILNEVKGSITKEIADKAAQKIEEAQKAANACKPI